MQRIIRFAACGGLVAVLAILLPLTVAAHERRDVADGQYRLVVGWLDEPAFVDLKNGLDLRVLSLDPAAATPGAGDEGTPVEGLADTLQAEVIYGDQTMELELEPRFGQPGGYQSTIFPTAEGDYTFRIFGEIEGTPIDESFTSGPETFSVVEPVEPYQFPKEEASTDRTVTFPAAAGGLGLALGGIGLWLTRRRAARAIDRRA